MKVSRKVFISGHRLSILFSCSSSFFLGKVNPTLEKFVNFWNLNLNLIKSIICSHSHVHSLIFFLVWLVFLVCFVVCLFVCFIDRVLSSCLGWHRSYHVTQVGSEDPKDPFAFTCKCWHYRHVPLWPLISFVLLRKLQLFSEFPSLNLLWTIRAQLSILTLHFLQVCF